MRELTLWRETTSTLVRKGHDKNCLHHGRVVLNNNPVPPPQVRLYETSPAVKQAELPSGAQAAVRSFTPDVARRAVAYRAKDGLLEKPGSLGARSQVRPPIQLQK